MFNLKKLTLITTLTLLTTCQAQAAKFIHSSTTPTETTTQPVATNNAVVAAAPAPAASASSRQAATATTAAATSGIDTGLYIGAQLGDSSVGAVMGYQFTKMFGMEISYDYFDPLYTRAVTTTTAEKNRLGASGLFMFPVKFSDMGAMALYVKVGYARTTDKLTTDDPGSGSLGPSTYITTTTVTGVTGGAGVHVDVSKSATARLGVNVVGSERATYLAVLYRF